MRYFFQAVVMAAPIMIIIATYIVSQIMIPELSPLFCLYVLYELITDDWFIAWKPTMVNQFHTNAKELGL